MASVKNGTHERLELHRLSEIWILSCNDDNPIITYRGLAYRFKEPSDSDIRALVRSRPELFRPGVSTYRLSAWKAAMRQGSHLPSWISDIEDESKREEEINSLKRDDVFRNQFRAKDNAPRCDLATIDWGLEHIDRLRKAVSEQREETTKKIAIVIIPLVSIAIAVLSVFNATYVQLRTTDAQTQSKMFEVTLKPKQDAYTLFMGSLIRALDSANSRRGLDLRANLDTAEGAYYAFEPFLTDDQRNELWGAYQEFAAFCYDVEKRPVDRDSEDFNAQSDKFLAFKTFFRDKLFSALFH